MFAETGGICITESVYQDIRNEPGVEVDFLGGKMVKSVDHPVNVYAFKLSEGTGLQPLTEQRYREKKDTVVRMTALAIIGSFMINYTADKYDILMRVRWEPGKGLRIGRDVRVFIIFFSALCLINLLQRFW